jgi:tetratricopeptide (TPR) repeat protein
MDGAVPATAASLPGQVDVLEAAGQLGRYTLLRRIGQGGQGTVYEALQQGPAGFVRRVALKLVQDSTGLRREARLGGLLRHPNLVDVYEVGEHEGRWFLAMEFCPDGTLATRRPLPLRAVVEVGLAVCSALQHAHDELGLVHLDLKPQNLLLAGPVVKVADLGIARLRGEAARVAGTRGYMAPELLRGEPVDARADIYALGVVLRELAAPPAPRTFAGARSETLPYGEDLDPDEVTAPELGPLQPVLQRCLAYDARDRYPSMAALAADLRAWPAGGPGLAASLALRSRPAPGRRPEEPPPPLIGREHELAQLDRQLREPGLVTLRGPAGVGKSRLAREAAHRYVLGPARTAELSEARSLRDLLVGVARALEISLVGGEDEQMVGQIGQQLARRGPVLLVLDSFELPRPSAALLSWLTLAPQLRLLVTSQAPLGLAGEQILEVEPLPEADAVAFIESVAQRRGVDLRGEPLVLELARRLEGLPLALELAAGRLGVLSLQDVLERLSLSLLRSGQAGLSPRQATLRGALAWSWELLDPEARSALAQLSVFRGGSALEATDEVVELPPGVDLLDVVGRLLDRSLLVARAGRLSMLEAVRTFAEEQLQEPASAQRRHGLYFSQTSYRWDEHASIDLDNLVHACRGATERGEPDVAAAALERAWRLLDLRGPLSLGLELAALVRAMPGLLPAQRGAVAYVEGAACRRLGRTDAALVHLHEALRLAVEQGRPQLEVLAVQHLGELHRERGQPGQARTWCERALALTRALGLRVGEGSAQGLLAIVHWEMGQLDEARTRYEEALSIERELGNRPAEAAVLCNLGSLLLERNLLDQAHAHYLQSLEVYRELGIRRAEGIVLAQLGVVRWQQGHLPEARALGEQALLVHREVGNRPYEGIVHSHLGLITGSQELFAEADAHLQQALLVHREVGNRRAEANELTNLGELRFGQGQLAEARRYLEQAAVLHRQVGHRRIESVTWGCLGLLAALEGEAAQAEHHLQTAEALLAADADPLTRCTLLCYRAEVAHLSGDHTTAEAQLAEAEALVTQLPTPGDTLERKLARVRARLGLPRVPPQ